MAGELQLAHNETGKTLYALIRNATGSVWNTGAAAFQSYATANLASYALTLAEQGTASRYYAGTFPAAIPAGTYAVAAFERAGGSPAEGDPLAAAGNVEWDGSALTALSSRLAASAYAAPDNATITSIQTDTNDIQARLPAALVGGRIDSAVGALANDVITAASIATAALDADALAADAVAEIVAAISFPSVPTANQNADALLDRTAGVEATFTVRQALRLMLAALAGKLSGAATTTVTIRAADDSKDRLVATVDADGNRTALTLDAS